MSEQLWPIISKRTVPGSPSIDVEVDYDNPGVFISNAGGSVFINAQCIYYLRMVLEDFDTELGIAEREKRGKE